MTKSPTDGERWHRWVSVGGTLPVDVTAVVAFLVVGNGVLYSPLAESVAVRALVGFPLLFFLPGYALVTGLFPGTEASGDSRLNWRAVGDRSGSTLRDRGVDWRERLALSFASSIALLPLLALALSMAGASYGLAVLTPTLTGFVVLGMAVGVLRRRRLPPQQRFQIPYRKWASTVDEGLFGQRSALDAALNVALALIVLSTVAGVGYAVVTPNNGESYTSVSLLTQNAEGNLTASGYPDALHPSENQFVVRLENHEGASTGYTVVGELQRVRRSDGSVSVVRGSEVLRTSTTLAPGETWTGTHNVDPTLSGEDLRLVYYVYEGEAPADPSTESAYRYVNIWVDAP